MVTRNSDFTFSVKNYLTFFFEIYLCVRACVCVHVCAHICACVRFPTCLFVHMCVCTKYLQRSEVGVRSLGAGTAGGCDAAI